MSSHLQTPVFTKDKSYEVAAAAMARVYWSCKGKQSIFIYLSWPDDDETKIKERAFGELNVIELKNEKGRNKLIDFW